MGCVTLKVLVGLCSVICGNAFNLDVTPVNIKKYSGDPGSMFGFSVALFKGNATEGNWVLVGAPNGQSSATNVDRGGVVFRCSILSDECIEIPFYAKINSDENGIEVGIRNFQWLGATVVAAEYGAAMMACAPRYSVNIGYSYDSIEPVGTCWMARNNFQEFREYSPCRTSEWQYTHRGYCQAGLGAGISKNGKQLFIGAPGSNLWKGEITNVNATKDMSFLPPRRIREPTARDPRIYERVYEPPQVYYSGILDEQDTYLGYSVAVGEFYGLGNTSVAVGRPRGSDLAGQVDIFTWDLKLLKNISGDQIGSYFGSSLCACDVDGDGNDDLIIGAPFYTQSDQNEYEVGRIFIYLQKNHFESFHTINGSKSQMRFGFSLSCLGDINKDSYEDIAVGAPYKQSDSSPEGQGAVYIYLGSKNGTMQQPAQTIIPNDSNITTFGFSISGGMDLDNNEYPDLVVGAYEANSAFFFRTRPVVKVDAEVTFNITSRQLDLKNPNCVVEGKSTNCLSIKTCLNFSGIRVNQQLDFEILLLLDLSYDRMYFQNSEQEQRKNFTLLASIAQSNCIDFDVYIKPKTTNLHDLEVTMTYSLVSDGKSGGHNRLSPVLDIHSKAQSNTLTFVQSCGLDNICMPELFLTVNSSVKTYKSGSGDFYVTVLVENKGEDAFKTIFSLKLPKGLHYGGVERLDRTQIVPLLCIPYEDVIFCYIGDSFLGNQKVEFKIILQPTYNNLPSNYTFYTLEAEIHTNGIDQDGKSIPIHFKKETKIPIQVEAVLNLKGSLPTDVLWNSLNYTKESEFEKISEIGPLIIHEYTILNEGSADIVEADIILTIPSRTLSGDNFLYLQEQPETSSKISCKEVPEVNYLKLKITSENTTFNESSTLKQNFTSANGLNCTENMKNLHPRSQNSIFLENTKSKQVYFRDGSKAEQLEKIVTNRRKRAPDIFQNNTKGATNQCNANNLTKVSSSLEELVECKEMNCTKISCNLLAALGRNQEALITLKMRVWVSTLKKLKDYRKIELFTRMGLKITRLPYIGVPEKPIVCSHQIFSTVISTDIIAQHNVPLWVVVVSTVAGALVLSVIIFLLYKCGFFKRKNAPETQLKTNENEMETNEVHQSIGDEMYLEQEQEMF